MEAILQFLRSITEFTTQIGKYIGDFFSGILGIFNLSEYVSQINPLSFLPSGLIGIFSVALPIVIALRVIGRDK